MSQSYAPAPIRRVVKRSTAAALLRLCVRTLVRREKSDPRFPQRVALGLAGGAPWGYLADELTAYVDGLPRSRPAAAVADRAGAASPGVAGAVPADTPPATPEASQKPKRRTSASSKRPGSGSTGTPRRGRPRT